MRRIVLAIVGLLHLTFPIMAADAARPGKIATVSVRQTTFNPSVGDDVDIHVALAAAGKVTVLVLDRDGFPIRTLAANSEAAAALNRYSWDGRADDGRVVPDEAYSLHVSWSDGRQRETYFPADAMVHMVAVPVKSYSARASTIVYELPVPSRVHLQAGVAAPNDKTKAVEGPVMKTVVNREPRAAGRVAEHWNGFDESGAVFLPELPHFVMAVATTPLPENSIVTVGNRGRTFLEHAATRAGRSLLTRRPKSHAHHAGLSALDDVSPPLRVEPLNAVWSEADRTWRVPSGAPLRLRVSVTGPAARAFAAQPGTLFSFSNARLVRRVPVSHSQMEVEVPAGVLDKPLNLVSINWQSEYGGVAANTVRVRTGSATPRGGAAR